MKRSLQRILIAVIAAVMLVLVPTTSVLALTTADITVTATPSFISISINGSPYDFSAVTESSNTTTASNHFMITNASTIQTDMTIAVTGANWTGGEGWIHSDTATRGVSTVGLVANQEGTWDASPEIIVKFAAVLNYIKENAVALTNYSFGLRLLAPSTFHDGDQKTNVVRITAASG